MGRPRFTDEQQRAARFERGRRRNARLKAERHARGLKKHRVDVVECPPSEVLAARDAMLPPRDLTALLLGDPLPGRSALDQRGRGF